jgi:flagellar motor switch protein FliN
MTDVAAQKPSQAIQEYAQVWAECASSVLESTSGKAFTGAPRTETEPLAIPAEEAVWLGFKVTGKLAGDQCFQLKKPDAVRLGQLLMSEPLDGAAALSEKLSDALSELFRQFAGVVSTNCKPKYGGEVQFQLEAGKPPEWAAAATSAWAFAAPEIDSIQWNLLLSAELCKSLEGAGKTADTVTAAGLPAANAAEAPAQAAKPATAGTEPATASTNAGRPSDSVSRPPASERTTPSPTNLDLLLDVELKASLRFGQREMMLREILALRPGSVIELDKQIQEPAELLVAGRVIAWGDVVIVDGNYGLRIKDIAQPQQWLASVET